jgi:diaminohydroxyphosphoribosylaminopyrimidine deaminase/5-amino-6-(5-phosphoribosylamino)uracil reductase
MARALRLAAAGTGGTYPNPCVGAVVVAGGKVVGAGKSRPTGAAHAEVVALRRAGEKARGATLYVTLEPCRHFGRTPPCTRAIVEAGIARIVVGVRDPATHARGRGLRELARAGVEVLEGVAAERARAVHAHYLHQLATGRPFVTLKAAVSLDGQIAPASGQSRWITGEAARRDAHRLRAGHHAVAIGSRTLRSDDPALTVRLVRGRDPTVVVFDSRLRSAGLLGKCQALRPGTLVLYVQGSPRAVARLHGAGLRPIEVAAGRDGRVDISAALRALGRREIRSLLVEGGGELLGSFVRTGLWQTLVLYQAPRLLGRGRALLAGLSYRRVDDGPRLTVRSRRVLGDDLRIELAPSPPRRR